MQLKSHLVAQTRPQAKLSNFVFWKDYRVAVLGARLFRIEKNRRKRFRDDATTSVWFRDMPKQSFTVRISKDEAIVETEACALRLKPKKSDCRVILNGREIPLDNAENLGGTYRTLDCCDGDIHYQYGDAGERTKISLGNGVCSRTGVAYFDDAHSLTLDQNGEVRAERGEGIDYYVFAYGDDYRGAVKALYSITGASPMLPRYAFGNWWSRFYPYSDKEYLRLLQRFADHKIPLTVAVVDMDWHYFRTVDEKFGVTEKGRNTDFYGGDNGWTGYTWNEELFPDYKAFLKKVEERSLKISLNLHPALGIRWFEKPYVGMAKAVGIDPETCQKIDFDMTDVRFINGYFSEVHNPYEEDGVAFWWVDWQQGTQSKMDGLDPLWLLNHYHYYDIARTGKTPMILSRYGGIGSHRYPVGFSGDALVTWKTLAYLPYFTATASNVGYGWWSHDIGGHMLGETNGELYVRHLQYGAFSPINRLHSSDEVTMTKEPWYYGNGMGEIAAKYLRFRHSMIPFLYSASYCAERDGEPLVQPLYYEWKTPEAYAYKTEYLFGGLLVAPVTSPVQKDGYARVKVWLPEGKWTDIFTGDTYTVGVGGAEKTLLRKIDDIPALVKAGGILPLSTDVTNGARNPEILRILAYEGNGGYTLFEDGKEEGKRGEYKTFFESSLSEANGEKTQRLKIYGKGARGVLPKGRTLSIEFPNVKNGEVKLYENGLPIEGIERIKDCAAIALAYKPNAEYLVEVTYRDEPPTKQLLARAQEILCQTEWKNTDKFRGCYRYLTTAKTVEEFKEILQNSPIPECAKLRILETL